MNVRWAKSDEVMKIVEEIKRKNPETLKFLGYPATFRVNKRVKK